ncbi:MAG: DUF3089 domain-containing protein [Gemmatimonadaceae bacterium]|nr:DUF3089 domain-containing protein [Chitinophagaceae bacterium]
MNPFLPASRLLLLSMLLFGCSPKYLKHLSVYDQPASDSSLSTYANPDNWAALPGKHDPSDSIPAPLIPEHLYDSTVDVFFIHPTSFTDRENPDWNAALSDPTLNAKTDYSSMLYQASAFNEYRVFAPRYRQANMRSYFTIDTSLALQAFELAYQDVRQAFLYYLSNYNNNHPIIIASHSQGSNHSQRLLKEFFENGELKKQLVAAYILGMYIPNNYFTQLRMCADSTQAGCLIGWRTYKKDYLPDFVKKENNTGLVTNPLTWTTTGEYAPHTLNKGSVLRNFNKLNKYVAGAEIKNGVLWIDKLHMPGGFLIRRKNFHIGDINIFYINIRDDLRRRVTNYRKTLLTSASLNAGNG